MLLWYDEALEHYLYLQSHDKKTIKKINQLIKDIQRNPFEGTGKPEALIKILLLHHARVTMMIEYVQKSVAKFVKSAD